MRTPLLASALALAASVAPTAIAGTAECHVLSTFPTVTQICVYDASWTTGDCSDPQPYASQSHQSAIVVDWGLLFYAHAGGFDQCWATQEGAGGASSGISAGITTYSLAPTSAAGAGWQEWSYPGASGCGIYAYASTAAGYQWQEIPCIAGAPPNPGWGTLLP